MKRRVPFEVQLVRIPAAGAWRLARTELVDDIETVSTDEAKAMARRLASEEGIFAGISTGANVVAALRVAQRLGEGKTVVTIAVDSGLRYLSTDVFRHTEER